MSFIYNIFLIPIIARQIIANGRPWNLAYSLTAVVASFITFDVWAKDSGCRIFGLAAPCVGGDMASSIFTLLLFVGFWALATIITSIIRAETFNQPVGIDMEAHCLALPFMLVWLAIPIIRFLSMVLGGPFWILINNKPENFLPYNLELALLINIVIFIVFAVTLATALTLISEPGNQALKGSMSRQIARLYKGRLEAHRLSSFQSVVIAACLIILGGWCWGYQDVFAGAVRFTPAIRGLHAAGFSVLVWLVMSWAVGRCRDRHINDPLGMNMALSSIGWSTARFAILLISVSIIRDLFGRSAGLDAAILKLVLFAAIPIIIDAFLSASSALIVRQARPAQDQESENETDNLLKAAEQVQLQQPTYYQSSLDYFARISLPSFRTAISYLWRMMTLKGLGVMNANQTSDEAISIHTMGFAILGTAAIVHGIALSRVGVPAIGRFAGTGMKDLDYTLGFAAVLIYAVVIAAVLHFVLRALKQELPLMGLAATVGYSFFVPMVAMIICATLPQKLGFELGGVLNPVALLWALGFCVIEIGMALTDRSKFAVAMSGTAVSVALTYLILTPFVTAAHLSVLTAMRVPIEDMRETIYYEVSPALRGDLESAMSNFGNVDIVDVKAGDLVRHVKLVNSVGRRFYDQVPSEMFPLRLRHEVTSNAGWMQKLKPLMADVTRDAKTPADAVMSVTRWVKSVVPKPEAVAFPFGEKFEQDPLTTLNTRCGSDIDVAILTVAALRASGVAARMVDVMPDEYVSGTYRLAEYYDGEVWKPCYPSLDVKEKPQALESDVTALQSWAEKIPEPARLTFYVPVNGIWYPYCTAGRDGGDGEPGGYSFDLPPGTYLATYVEGNTSHTRKFVLRPAMQQ